MPERRIPAKTQNNTNQDKALSEAIYGSTS